MQVEVQGDIWAQDMEKYTYNTTNWGGFDK